MSDQPEDVRMRRQLAGHPFAQGLAPADLDVFQELAERVGFDAHETVFRSGDHADRFYLIRSGVVSLTFDAGGAFPRTIELLSEGSALGWSWLFEPYEWQFDAVAQTPVRAIAFDAEQLRGRFQVAQGFGYRVMLRVAEVIAQRLHATRRQVLNLSD